MTAAASRRIDLFFMPKTPVPSIEAASNTPSNDVTGESLQSRRIAYGLLAVGTAWAAIVTLFSRVLLAYIDALALSPIRVEQLFTTMRLHGVAAGLFCVCLLIVRRRKVLTARWPKVILVMMLALLVVSFDRIVGYCYPPPRRLSPIVVRHPRRCFGHQPNKLGVLDGVETRTNQFGFRGPDVSSTKAPNTTRILFLGDSVTFGTQLGDDQTPVTQVQRYLETHLSSRRSECLNAGVCGYATWQELDLLKDEGLAAEPDVVVLQFCLNDMIDVAGVERGVLIGNRIRFDPPASFHWSGTVRAITTLVNQQRNEQLESQQHWAADRLFAEVHSAALQELDDVYRDPPLPVVREAWNKCYEDLDGVARVCRENSLRMMLVYSPVVYEIGDAGKYRQPSRFLRAWANDAEVPFLDLTGTYLPIRHRAPSEFDALFMDNLHVSRAGAKVMGEAIGRFLIDSGLLPNTDQR